MDDIEVQPGVVIPGDELTETHSRSGGPGGQHVNTSSTRISLRWNLAETRLRPGIKDRLLERLGPRLTQTGELVVHADQHRSQLRNREDARERLAATVRAALVREKPRRETRPTRSSQRRRVNAKKQQGDKKKLRGRVQED